VEKNQQQKLIMKKMGGGEKGLKRNWFSDGKLGWSLLSLWFSESNTLETVERHLFRSSRPWKVAKMPKGWGKRTEVKDSTN